MTDRADTVLAELVAAIAGPGLRRAVPRQSHCTRYAAWSAQELKAEARRLRPLTGKSVSACAREFGVPRETLKDWLDSVHRPTSTPPIELVEWFACLVDARSFVRRAS